MEHDADRSILPCKLREYLTEGIIFFFTWVLGKSDQSDGHFRFV